MKKCNECGQVINYEMFNDLIRDVRLQNLKRKTKTKNLIDLDTLSKILIELKEVFENNPESITILVDQIVDDIKNRENE
jgi:hypothetical protein